MRRSSLFLVGLVAATAALLAGIYTGSKRSGTSAPASPAVTAEAVANLFASSLEDVVGKPQPFSPWQGKTLVVNFWATWCPPCREEMPAFSRLQDRHAARGVQFVGIALDTADNVRAFAAAHPVNYPLLIGGAAGVDLARQFGNARLALPYTLLIAPDGDLRLVRLGPVSESELDLAVHQSLAR
jgi:thiol-disulfide isomerase/thioredoxin